MCPEKLRESVGLSELSVAELTDLYCILAKSIIPYITYFPYLVLKANNMTTNTTYVCIQRGTDKGKGLKIINGKSTNEGDTAPEIKYFL